MSITVNVYHHFPVSTDILTALNEIKELIMGTQTELAADIANVTAQVAKIGTETAALLQKVTDLQTIIDSQGGVSPELQAAVDALKAQITVVDDLVPDAPAAPVV